MDPLLSISYNTIVRFFEAVEGNYHNAIYIACNCEYQRESNCGDFLFAPGHDCIPVLFPLKDAELFIGTTIDPSDCSIVMDSKTFIRLYHKWIEMVTQSDSSCPLQLLLAHLNQIK